MVLALLNNGDSLWDILRMPKEELRKEFLYLQLSGLYKESDKTLVDFCNAGEISYIFCWSAANGHLEIVKYLAEQGADIHADNNFALQWSAYYGHLEIVEYLKSRNE
jgi:hypothetical protein